jgi:hypothetical protein
VRSPPPHPDKPFGTGGRDCIGRQLALFEATPLVPGLLLRRYEGLPGPACRLRVAERLALMPEGPRLRRERRTGTAHPVADAPTAEASEPEERGACPVQASPTSAARRAGPGRAARRNASSGRAFRGGPGRRPVTAALSSARGA